MKHLLIAGLGNPGETYNNTRHNIGFSVIDAIAAEFSFPVFSNKFSSYVSSKLIGTNKVTLIKPITYMNLSGNAIAQAIHFYKIDISDLIVIHDDLDLELARVKIKLAGGSGGHNGIKSIDQHLGLDYYRLRIGIGKPPHQKDVSNFVLSKFSTQENKIIEKMINLLINDFDLLLTKNISMLMNKLAMEQQKNGI